MNQELDIELTSFEDGIDFSDSDEDDSESFDYEDDLNDSVLKNISGHSKEVISVSSRMKKNNRTCYRYYVNNFGMKANALKRLVKLSVDKMKLLVSNVDFLNDKFAGIFTRAFAYGEYYLPLISYLADNYVVLGDLFDDSHPGHEHFEYAKSQKFTIYKSLLSKIKLITEKNLVYADFSFKNFRLKLKEPVYISSYDNHSSSSGKNGMQTEKRVLLDPAEVYLRNFEDVNFTFAYDPEERMPLSHIETFQDYWENDKSKDLRQESNMHSKTCKRLYVNNILQKTVRLLKKGIQIRPSLESAGNLPPVDLEDLFDEALSTNDAISNASVLEEFADSLNKYDKKLSAVGQINKMMKVVKKRPFIDKIAMFKAPEQFLTYFPNNNMISLATLIMKLELKFELSTNQKIKKHVDGLILKIDNAREHFANYTKKENKNLSKHSYHEFLNVLEEVKNDIFVKLNGAKDIMDACIYLIKNRSLEDFESHYAQILRKVLNKLSK